MHSTAPFTRLRERTSQQQLQCAFPFLFSTLNRFAIRSSMSSQCSKSCITGPLALQLRLVASLSTLVTWHLIGIGYPLSSLIPRRARYSICSSSSTRDTLHLCATAVVRPPPTCLSIYSSGAISSSVVYAPPSERPLAHLFLVELSSRTPLASDYGGRYDASIWAPASSSPLPLSGPTPPRFQRV
ncbi:hypothetical protein C8R45DRAFT_384822 [Mycena sanguinolenta]|nr:hypothetical protein C8R45DRAFT_384822 [Mycena sanguinolenta]